MKSSLLLTAALLFTASVHAATRYWDTFTNTNNNFWTDAANWDNPPFTSPSSGDVIVFRELEAAGNNRGECIVNLDGPFHIARLRILDGYNIHHSGSVQFELEGNVETGTSSRTTLLTPRLKLAEAVDFVIEPAYNLVVADVDVRGRVMRVTGAGKLYLEKSTGNQAITVAGGNLRAVNTTADDIVHSIYLESGSVGGQNRYSSPGPSAIATISQLFTLPASTGKIAPGTEGHLSGPPLRRRTFTSALSPISVRT